MSNSIILSVTEKMLALKAKGKPQMQARMGEKSAAILWEMAGKPTQTIVEKVNDVDVEKTVALRIGSPLKGKAHLKAVCQYKGREIVLIVGDTHAIWLEHQTGADAIGFMKAVLGALTSPAMGIQLEVLSVEVIGGGAKGAAGASAEVMDLNW